MSEQPISATATVFDGSWKLEVTHEDGKSIARVWAFGALLSVTTLSHEDGSTTAEVPQTS
ncbi:hypothetical protein [Streptomyces sp. NPDC001070]